MPLKHFAAGPLTSKALTRERGRAHRESPAGGIPAHCTPGAARWHVALGIQEVAVPNTRAMETSYDIAASPPGPATRAPHGAAADGKGRRRSRVGSRGMPVRHVLLALATVASSEALVPTAGGNFQPPRPSANSMRRATHGRNDVR